MGGYDCLPDSGKYSNSSGAACINVGLGEPVANWCGYTDAYYTNDTRHAAWSDDVGNWVGNQWLPAVTNHQYFG
jgi:hypothetical protein